MSSFITKLDEGQIFVFGSNLAGRHGKGAAKQAQQWGARRGYGSGLHGQTYGIPTKDGRYSHDRYLKKVLPVREIKVFVEEFIATARLRTDLTFLVTEIGCGLSGYTPQAIAPLFIQAQKLPNVVLPASFVAVLGSLKENV